jgi:hypothetical protein
MDLFSYLLGKKAGGGSSSYDWSAIGYNYEPKLVNNSYQEAKEIYDSWDNTATSCSGKYNSNSSYGKYSFEIFPNVDTSNVTNMYRMFYYCYNLCEINDNFDFSNSTNCESMFAYCYNLQLLKNVIPANECNMKQMFYYCTNLKNIDTVRITARATGTSYETFGYINNLHIKKVILNAKTTGDYRFFTNCYDLDIEEITNESQITQFNKKILEYCTMTDRTIKAIFNYMKTLTQQESTYKTLKSLGFSSANCEQAILLPEWQEMVTLGWATGY